jgi:hypothetical protein
MRSTTVSVTGTGNSNPINMDLYISPFNVGMGAVVVSGTPTYTVQHSFDNPLATGYSAANATWFDHPDMTAQTANLDGNYAFPVAAIRLYVTGAGVAQLTVIQAGIVGG